MCTGALAGSASNVVVPVCEPTPPSNLKATTHYALHLELFSRLLDPVGSYDLAYIRPRCEPSDMSKSRMISDSQTSGLSFLFLLPLRPAPSELRTLPLAIITLAGFDMRHFLCIYPSTAGVNLADVLRAKIFSIRQ